MSDFALSACENALDKALACVRSGDDVAVRKHLERANRHFSAVCKSHRSERKTRIIKSFTSLGVEFGVPLSKALTPPEPKAPAVPKAPAAPVPDKKAPRMVAAPPSKSTKSKTTRRAESAGVSKAFSGERTIGKPPKEWLAARAAKLRKDNPRLTFRRSMEMAGGQWMNEQRKSLTGTLEKAKSESAPSLKPPKDWFAQMYAKIKSGNPGYSREQIEATIGSVWYHKMSGQKRAATRKSEGKKYGKAPKAKTPSKNLKAPGTKLGGDRPKLYIAKT